MITISNDAAGCYDRMRHNLTTITTRRVESPKEFALWHARVQNQMEHYVKTKAGVSTDFFRILHILILEVLVKEMEGVQLVSILA